MSDETTTIPKPRCIADQLEVGDHLSRVQYYRVVEINEDGFITVENTRGFKFKVLRDIAEAEMFSATQFDEELKVTRTELAEKLIHAGDTCFSVTFRKRVTDKQISAKLAELSADDLATDKSRRKLARELLKGEERVLVGYLVQGQTKLGRSMVIDLTVHADEHNIRMVDHRTIKSLVYKNVRYFCD